MSSLDETNVQDLVDHLTDFQADLQDKREVIATAFIGINGFLNHPQDEKEIFGRKILYQFRDDTQGDYLKHKVMIDSELSAVYPLVKDLTRAFSSLVVQDNSQQQVSQGGITINTASQPAQKLAGVKKFFQPFRRQDVPENLEDLLENPWVMSKDIIEEAKNTPRIWRKFVRLHENIRIRDFVYEGEGTGASLKLEVWYFNAQVQPEINKMINATDQIMSTENMTNIVRVLTRYYEMSEKHRLDSPPPSKQIKE